MTSPGLHEPGVPVTGARTAGVTRRRWLYAAVAGAASLAGMAIGWWTSRPATAPSDARLAIWDMRFESPGKGPLSMQQFSGRPLLLNFWATWCPPCIEELPLLDGFFQKNAGNGWQVLGIAADQADAVQAFLARAPVHFPVAMAGMAGIELSRSLGNLSGGLPFTVVLGAAGHVLHRKMGRVSIQDLNDWSALH